MPTLNRDLINHGGLAFLFFLGIAAVLVLTYPRNGALETVWKRFFRIAGALGVLGLVSVLLGIGLVFPLRRGMHEQKLLLEKIAKLEADQLVQTILDDPRHRDPKKLNHYEFKVFSQNGEDGVIHEIFRRIGVTNRFFVEFGASYGTENNTAFLLRQGWSGFWMDGDPAAVKGAKATFAKEIQEKRLNVLETFITAENIESLFQQANVPTEFDLLSIDIDRNDYHVWKAITNFKPRCVVIEYNPTLPPTLSWVVPYEAKAWGHSGYGVGNGASLLALVELAATKGYSLVGCELGGVNAFFVRNDLLKDRFAAPYTADYHYEPFRVRTLSEYFPRMPVTSP